MRKIMIFYASYGGGHLSAARSIKENIEANYKDVEVMLVDCMYYVNKFFDKVTTTAYSEMAKKIPQTWGKVYWHAQSGPIAQISTTSNKLLSKKLNNFFNFYLHLLKYLYLYCFCVLAKSIRNFICLVTHKLFSSFAVAIIVPATPINSITTGNNKLPFNLYTIKLIGRSNKKTIPVDINSFTPYPFQNSNLVFTFEGIYSL